MKYEIHATVETDNIEGFKEICGDIGVKPIVIETEKEGIFNRQVMTSSKHSGRSYKKNLKAITGLLTILGYEVLRVKIEIKPEVERHKDFIYYEAHLRLKLTDDKRPALIELCELHNFHLSKNIFKIGDGFNYQMVTYRDYNSNLNDFNYNIFIMGTELTNLSIPFDKIEIEECIYDSNISIDKNWI